MGWEGDGGAVVFCWGKCVRDGIVKNGCALYDCGAITVLIWIGGWKRRIVVFQADWGRRKRCRGSVAWTTCACLRRMDGIEDRLTAGWTILVSGKVAAQHVLFLARVNTHSQLRPPLRSPDDNDDDNNNHCINEVRAVKMR